jgi:hypothetical protein
MSDELFEVAFSGQISEGADLQEVKARVGKMFNADSAKTEQLFSGQRIVIKKNIDQQTALKYKKALHSAGAECDIKAMPAPAAAGAAAVVAPPPPSPDSPAPAASATSAAPAANESTTEVAAPPRTDPLGISGDQINALEATIAPVGSELQSEIKQVPEPQYDLSAFDMAPVGSTLADEKKDPPPPPPDTSGLSMAD